MPNWCCNKYAFFTNDENKSELLRLHKNLSEIFEIPSETANIFDSDCLEKVADFHKIDREGVSCVGWVDNLEDCEPDDNYFTLYTQTAWTPENNLWEAVITQYEGIYFVFIAEEPGSDIYINTDIDGVYLCDKYLLEIWGDASIPEGWYTNQEKPGCLEIREYFEDFDDVMDYCAKTMGKEFKNIEEIKSYINNIFEDEENTIAGIHEFTPS